MKVEVQKYRKPDGYATRYWSETVDGELLAVTVYRKGAVAVANAINNTNRNPYVTTVQDSAQSDYLRKPSTTGVETSSAR